MRRLIAGLLIGILLLTTETAKAQPKKYTVANAHSHNDYLNVNPFYTAFENGFGSIEADIFPVDSFLYVAHHKKEIQSKNTLQTLYIEPLVKAFNSGSAKKINLLIDIKENPVLSLTLLLKILEPLKRYLSTDDKANYLTIVISGERPLPSDYKNYPGFIFFDYDLKTPHNKQQLQRVALVSLPFDKISKWRGGELEKKEREQLKKVIDTAHVLKKPIRFWAAPDTEESWKLQMKLGADFIGTDRIEDLGKFLRKEKSK